MSLADRTIVNFKPNGKLQKHPDGGGLYLYVTPTGSKLWKMAYRFDHKQKSLSFGPYPLVTLKKARELRDEAKLKLMDGIDPGVLKSLSE